MLRLTEDVGIMREETQVQWWLGWPYLAGQIQ